MSKSFIFVLATLLFAVGASAQEISVRPISPNTTYNWATQNSKACTITKSGTTFTPTCPVNYITIDASGETIALPSFAPANTSVSTFKLVISYSGSFTPTFATGHEWINGTAPPTCGGGTTTGCISAVSTATDWILCDTIDATHVGCGAPLTAVSPSIQVLSGATSTESASSGITSQSVSLNLTAGTTLIVGAGNSGNVAISSITGTGIGSCSAFTGARRGTPGYSDIWYCAVSSGGSGVSVTVNYGSSTGNVTVSAIDVVSANASPDDGIGNNAGFNSSVASYSVDGTGTTTQAGELIVVCTLAIDASFTITAGSGYTLVGTPTVHFAMEYAIQAAAGTPSGGFSVSPNTANATLSLAAVKHQ